MQDDFSNRLLSRLPPRVAMTLTDSQLQALKQALGDRPWPQHPVDIRRGLPLFGGRLYLVFLLGRERRSAERLAQERLAHPFWTLANSAALLAILLFAFIGFAVVLYTVKMLLGINVFPGIDMLPDGAIKRLIPWFGG